MEWLSQNWIWLVVVAVVLRMLWRRGHGGMVGGCCASHDVAHKGSAGEDKSRSADSATPPAKEAAVPKA